MAQSNIIKSHIQLDGYLHNGRSLYEVVEITRKGAFLRDCVSGYSMEWTFKELVDLKEVIPEIPDSPDSLC